MTIDEKTKIPLYVATTAVVGLLGFSFWLTTLYSMVVEAQKINEKQDQKLELLYEIKQDVAIIKRIIEDKK